jgi:hypothetical protein
MLWTTWSIEEIETMNRASSSSPADWETVPVLEVADARPELTGSDRFAPPPTDTVSGQFFACPLARSRQLMQ